MQEQDQSLLKHKSGETLKSCSPKSDVESNEIRVTGRKQQMRIKWLKESVHKLGWTTFSVDLA